MHIQHTESTSGHTVNISGAPFPHNTKLTFNTLCGPMVQNPDNTFYVLFHMVTRT